MQITISTKTHYEETAKKGVGHDANVPAEVAAKWRKVLDEYEKIRLEMESYYKVAYDSYFSNLSSVPVAPIAKKPRKKNKIR